MTSFDFDRDEAVVSFSPRAGIRGFDTQEVQAKGA
jgi:hypothetical protein